MSGERKDEREEGERFRERMQDQGGRSAMTKSRGKDQKEAGQASKREKGKNQRMETGKSHTEVRTKSMRAKTTRQQPTRVGNYSYSKLPLETCYFRCLHYKLPLHPWCLPGASCLLMREVISGL